MYKLLNLLSYLIFHRDRIVPHQEFIGQFWPEVSGTTPINALKTQLFRIRKTLEPLFGPEVQPVLSRRGGYQWNPDISVQVDTEKFEVLLERANRLDTSAAKRETLLLEAIQLYRGDFLPKWNHYAWVGAASERYHGMYQKAVSDYCSILEQRSLYESSVELMRTAASIYPLDEMLHTGIVRGLLRQKKYTEALAHYEYATDLLYRNLGHRQWGELRDLYSQLVDTEHVFESDLDVIQEQLRESDEKTGAFYCQYGCFQEIYRLEARRCRRKNTQIHIALLTILNKDGSIPAPQLMDKAMERLREAITSTLRAGDWFTRYSNGQYLMMLPDTSQESSQMIASRILGKFRVSRLRLSLRLRQLDLS